jgi:hypothetical protein
LARLMRPPNPFEFETPDVSDDATYYIKDKLKLKKNGAKQNLFNKKYI